MIDQILNKYRIDGPIDSPLRFLTIEDGVGSGDFENSDQVKAYFSRSKKAFTWIPKGKLVPGDVGDPGEWIAKIMVSLINELNNITTDYSTYISDNLYKHNEHNIKFFPFGRSRVNFFPPWIEEFLELSNTEYKQEAVAQRTNVFANLFRSKPAKVNIILGSENEWWNVFKIIYPNIHTKDQGDYIRSAYSGDAEDNLVYIYFGIFARVSGSKDGRAIKVASLIGNELKKLGIERI